MHAGRGTIIVGPVFLGNQEGMASEANLSSQSQYMIDRIVNAEALSASQTTSTALREAQLEKLVINAMINPLTVIFNCRNGQLFDQMSRVGLMRLLLAEAGAIVRALLPSEQAANPRFSDATLEELVKSIAINTSDNISSMLQDVRAARKTEIDYINGYIVRQGKKLCLPHRHNATLVELVKKERVIINDNIADYFPGF
jgi:2-dehydropantoate 2-reductase